MGDKNLVVIFNKTDLKSFTSVKAKWINQIPNLNKIKSFSISCKDNKDSYNMLIKLLNLSSELI